jgi:hypothetical protein
MCQRRDLVLFNTVNQHMPFTGLPLYCIRYNFALQASKNLCLFVFSSYECRVNVSVARPVTYAASWFVSFSTLGSYFLC